MTNWAGQLVLTLCAGEDRANRSSSEGWCPSASEKAAADALSDGCGDEPPLLCSDVLGEQLQEGGHPTNVQLTWKPGSIVCVELDSLTTVAER